MKSFNRVILMGNVTRDLELRYISTGTAVTDLGLAVNDRRKSPSGEWIDEVTFVEVTVWGRSAEVACEYLGKGKPVLIEGRLKLDTWEGKEGEKRQKLKVVCENLCLVGARVDGDGSGGGGAARRSGPPQRAPQNAPPSDEFYPDQSPPEPPAGNDIPF